MKAPQFAGKYIDHRRVLSTGRYSPAISKCTERADVIPVGSFPRNPSAAVVGPAVETVPSNVFLTADAAAEM